MAGGWVKVYREFTEWEWYSNVNVSRVFFHLLLTANHKETKWQGQVILPGQKVTSYENLAAETNLSVKQVRVALDKLKASGTVAVKRTNRFSVISIVNWRKYQDEGFPDGIQDDKPMAIKGQTEGKQRATNKNDKNEKNEKNIDICPFFEDLWQAYPNKKGKNRVTKSALVKIAEIGYDRMLNAVKTYRAEVTDTDVQYIKHGSTFFNGGYEDYLDRPAVAEDYIWQGMNLVPIFHGGQDG